MLYPPAPLGTRFHREVNQLAVSRMVNAIYAAYDTMDFGKLGWAYWHARCAPVHMAAAHYGAAIEGLYRKYVDGHPEKFRTKIVGDKSVWKSLQDALMKSVSESALEPSDKKLIAAKISNLNAMPFRLVADQLFTALGVPLGEAEIGAWDRRNDAAHGEGVGVETLIPTVMDTRLLMLVLHRLVLKIAESNDSYIDWWSPGMPVRKIVEPVPPPDRASI